MTKKHRLIALLTAVVLTLTLTTVTAAAEGRLLMNVSPYRQTTSLLNGEFVQGTNTATVRENLYVNVATDLYKITRVEFYVSCNGEKENLIHVEDPTGWMRYAYAPYSVDRAGEINFRVVVYLDDGSRGEGYVTVRVSEPNTATESDEGIEIYWPEFDGTTGFTTNSNHWFTLNGHKIVPGTIHATYFSDGSKSNAGTAYYVKLHDELVYVGGAQCMSFAYYCQNLEYGEDSHMTQLFDSERDDGKTAFFGVRVNDSLTGDELKSLIANAGNEHVHIRTPNHSIYLLGVYADGFFYTDANATSVDNQIRLGYTLFDDFDDYIRYIEYHQ